MLAIYKSCSIKDRTDTVDDWNVAQPVSRQNNHRVGGCYQYYFAQSIVEVYHLSFQNYWQGSELWNFL